MALSGGLQAYQGDLKMATFVNSGKAQMRNNPDLNGKAAYSKREEAAKSKSHRQVAIAIVSAIIVFVALGVGATATKNANPNSILDSPTGYVYNQTDQNTYPAPGSGGLSN